MTENMWRNGGLKQPVTNTQREPTDIIQQCNFEQWIQPGSHLCIVKHFGYVEISVLGPIRRT